MPLEYGRAQISQLEYTEMYAPPWISNCPRLAEQSNCLLPVVLKSSLIHPPNPLDPRRSKAGHAAACKP